MPLVRKKFVVGDHRCAKFSRDVETRMRKAHALSAVDSIRDIKRVLGLRADHKASFVKGITPDEFSLVLVQNDLDEVRVAIGVDPDQDPVGHHSRTFRRRYSYEHASVGDELQQAGRARLHHITDVRLQVGGRVCVRYVNSDDLARQAFDGLAVELFHDLDIVFVAQRFFGEDDRDPVEQDVGGITLIPLLEFCLDAFRGTVLRQGRPAHHDWKGEKQG